MHTYIYIYNTIVYVYNYNIYIERKQLQTTTANTRLMLMWNYPSFPIHPYPIHIPRSRLLLCSLHAGAWGLVDWVSLHDCARHLRGGFWAPNTWFTHLKKKRDFMAVCGWFPCFLFYHSSDVNKWGNHNSFSMVPEALLCKQLGPWKPSIVL